MEGIVNGDIGPQPDSPLDDLKVSIDPFTVDGLGTRKLKSIEPDGSLTYDDGPTPDVKLTETLGRIWNEYPGGMLDIKEEDIASRPPDDLAVEPTSKQDDEDVQGGMDGMMSLEDMEKLREEVLFQLNSSRNELWYVLELAKTLALSSTYPATPPVSTATISTPKKQRKPPPPPPPPLSSKLDELKANGITAEDPLVLPAGTFTTTNIFPPPRPLHAQVLDLEMALAAKEAALNECGTMIDAAVNELTTMASAGDRFWTDVRRLKDGKWERGQWAIVPRPDFGRVTGEGEKAKDVIIPYAIDEAPTPTSSRCLAAFDLDPGKPDSLAFGARDHLSLCVTLRNELGMSSTSTLTPRLDDTADVGDRMAEAQLEAFDEDLFAEIRNEVLRRGAGTVEPPSIKFDIGDQNLTFTLVDNRNSSTNTATSASNTTTPSDALPNLILLASRLSLLQTLRTRKRRLISTAATSTTTSSEIRSPSLLAPIVHILQYTRTVTIVQRALDLMVRIVHDVGVQARVVTRMGLVDVETVRKMLEDQGSIDMLGGVFSLHIKKCRGIMINTSAPSTLIVTTSRATFPLVDTSNLIPILSEDISFQLSTYLQECIKECVQGEKASGVFVDQMEETVQVPGVGSLRVSIPPPYDTIQAKIDGDASIAYDKRKESIVEWVQQLDKD